MSGTQLALAALLAYAAVMAAYYATHPAAPSRETLALERIAAALEQDMRACELTDFWPPEAAEVIEKAASMGERK